MVSMVVVMIAQPRPPSPMLMALLKLGDLEEQKSRLKRTYKRLKTINHPNQCYWLKEIVMEAKRIDREFNLLIKKLELNTYDY
jgi:hypothetical protein